MHLNGFIVIVEVFLSIRIKSKKPIEIRARTMQTFILKTGLVWCSENML